MRLLVRYGIRVRQNPEEITPILETREHIFQDEVGGDGANENDEILYSDDDGDDDDDDDDDDDESHFDDDDYDEDFSNEGMNPISPQTTTTRSSHYSGNLILFLVKETFY